MSVRQNVYGILNDASITALLAGGADGIHAGGSLTGAPYPFPFLIYRIQDEFSALRGDDDDHATDTQVQVWVYDKPGSYKTIELVLDAVRAAFRSSADVRARWTGDSQEFNDDEFKAILKYGSYSVAERVAA